MIVGCKGMSRHLRR